MSPLPPNPALRQGFHFPPKRWIFFLGLDGGCRLCWLLRLFLLRRDLWRGAVTLGMSLHDRSRSSDLQCLVHFSFPLFPFFPCRAQVPGGPEGAVRGNPASDSGPDPGVGYRDNPLRLPYPPQADGQPSADSSGQISVQTHGLGESIEQPKYLSGRKSKSTFF